MDDSLDEIREEYLANAYEEFDHLEEVLLNIENAGDIEGDMAEIFRVVHSLKGGSVSLDFPALTKVLHTFEEEITAYDLSSPISDFYETSMPLVDDLRIYCETYQKNPNAEIMDLESAEGKDVLFLSHSQALYEVARTVLDDIQLNALYCDHFEMGKKLYQEKKFKLIVVTDGLKNEHDDLLISHLKDLSSLNQNTPIIQVESLYNKENHSVSQLTIRLTRDKNFQENFKHAISASKTPILNQKKIRSILYIEDDQTLQKIFKVMMKKQKGIEVQVASSMSEGLEALKIFKPTLILLDNVLKEEKGEDVLENLSADKELKKIPVYLLTASPDLVSLPQLKKKGNLKAILGKPFKYDKLLKSYQDTI